MTTNWGPTTVARHTWWRERGVDLRVIVDGVDRTNDCRFFDDTYDTPFAELYRRNADGRIMVDDDGEPAVEIVHTFEIVPRLDGPVPS